jgi:syntaxin 8
MAFVLTNFTRVEQDTHLETLSHSIRRQREISENIGSELDVHTGLLEDLEVGLDRTAGSLGGARRRLETVGRGARENCMWSHWAYHAWFPSG